MCIFLPLGKNALLIYAYLDVCLNFVWRLAVRFSVCGAAVHLFYFRRTDVAKQSSDKSPAIFGGALTFLKNIFKAVDKQRKKLYNSVWYKKGANL